MRSNNMMRFLIAAYNHFQAHPEQVYYVDMEDSEYKRIHSVAVNNHWYFGQGNIAIYDGTVHSSTWDKAVIKNIIDGTYTQKDDKTT